MKYLLLSLLLPTISCCRTYYTVLFLNNCQYQNALKVQTVPP
jgi:hypothetical protein